MMATHSYPYSTEYEIDREIEALVAKIVAKTASPGDYSRYHELLAQRSRLMHPFPQRAERDDASRFASAA